ncbi:MAG: hypothetical protein HC872_05955 [Gammaproteobacteria bacterium]|nr:hypothetical protein [Gammaproteobacteria bacterium]
MPSVTLLGPQHDAPNLRIALRELGIDGPLAAITAGWQEREGENEELQAHVQAPVHDLQLYARAERVFAGDAQLQVAHRRRQARLSEMQDLYRVRLQHAKQAAAELLGRPLASLVHAADLIAFLRLTDGDWPGGRPSGTARTSSGPGCGCAPRTTSGGSSSGPSPAAATPSPALSS